MSLRNLISLVLLVSMTGCSTIRMTYKADVKTDDGRQAVYTLKKSYDVGGAQAPLCAISGILLGGVCWFYLAMPTVPQSRLIEADARARLDRTLGPSKYTIKKEDTDRESWSEGEEESKLAFFADAPTPKAANP